jgi:cysteine desulfurase/selenocysteine lyase
MIAAAHDAGAIVVVDACQLAAHAPIDVADLDCDFLACTGHKIYGPTGIGVLNGKRALLEAAPPFLGGGMMIHEVKSEGFTPAEIPHKFEAGTPPVTQAVGLAAAIDWQEQWSWKDRATHERMLMETALDRLGSIVDLHILGPANVNECFGCVSFTVGNVHPHDIAEIAGREGVCLRAGHHCCQPLHKRLGVAASTRLSFGLYNTVEEVERAVAVIQSAIKRFS